MKDYAKLALAVVAVIVIVIVGYLLIARVVYPAWFSIQRAAVEESKSFTDSNNNMLQAYVLEYESLEVDIAKSSSNTVAEAYRGQQQAIIWKMCGQIATMQSDTVQPSITVWLERKGGCQ